LKKSKVTHYRTLIGILISIIGLYLGFRKFDGREFLTALAGADLWYYLAAMLLMVLVTGLRAWRWQYLLRPLKPMPYRHVFAATMICYFGNNVFPLRMGEILRSYSLGKMENVSAVAVFGTVIVERVLDTIIFALILIAAAIFFPGLPGWVRMGSTGAVIIVVIFVVLLYILRTRQGKLRDFAKRKIAGLSRGKMSKLIDNFINGILTLRSSPHLAKIALQSIIIWVLSIVNIWVAGLAMDISLSVENLLLVFIVTSAIISIPSAPGYVGTYHAGLIGILTLLGFELALSQAFAVILHSVGFLSLTSIGVFYFIKYHVRVREAKILASDET